MEQITQRFKSQPKFLNETKPGTYINPPQREPSLRVEPTQIRFECITPGVLYVMTFSVRNTSKVAQRIRIQAPKSGVFALNYIPGGPVAPGIDIRAEIECQLPVNSSDMVFVDRIVATMGEHTVDLPIFACKPYANIKFSKLINIGTIAQGASYSKDFLFENLGDLKGTVKLNFSNDGASLRIVPTKFDIEPKGSEKSTQIVKVHFEGKEVGNFRETIKVNILGAIDESLIDVSAQVVEQKLLLLTENKAGALEVANFGPTFFGDKKTIKAFLVNTGPIGLNFAISYDEEDEKGIGEGGVPQTEDPNTSPKTLMMSPPDGFVKPFSHFPITVSFDPVYHSPNKGFIKVISGEVKDPKPVARRAYIDCVEMNQRTLVQLHGSGVGMGQLRGPPRRAGSRTSCPCRPSARPAWP